ncbi:MAG: DNA-binding protein [Pontibacterium sp.]
MATQKKLMKVSAYRNKYFEEGSAPSRSTVRRWIDNGELPGEVIGGNYYVNVAKVEQTTGNPLVDQVLLAS